METGKLTAQHIEHCETCAGFNPGTLRPEVLSGLLPLAALPLGLREPTLQRVAASSAATPRRPLIRRAGALGPTGFQRARTFFGWSRIRANPGAATAVAAVALWIVAATSATLITVTGIHAARALAAPRHSTPAPPASTPPASSEAPASPSPRRSPSPKPTTRPTPALVPTYQIPPPRANEVRQAVTVEVGQVLAVGLLVTIGVRIAVADTHAFTHADADAHADTHPLAVLGVAAAQAELSDIPAHMLAIQLHADTHRHAAVLAFARYAAGLLRFLLLSYFVLVSDDVVLPELYAGPNYG